MTDNDIRERGYLVQSTIPVNSVVTVIKEVRRGYPRRGDWNDMEYVTIRPGDSLVVTSYSNAGFRGIEASVRLIDGTRIHGLPAGYLATVSDTQRIIAMREETITVENLVKELRAYAGPYRAQRLGQLLSAAADLIDHGIGAPFDGVVEIGQYARVT